MKKTKGFAIFITALMLLTVFGATLTASADVILSLGIFVRKEGTEEPVNPLKVKVWYTRTNVPNPEEREASYVPQIGCWSAFAVLKDEVKELLKD